MIFINFKISKYSFEKDYITLNKNDE